MGTNAASAMKSSFFMRLYVFEGVIRGAKLGKIGAITAHKKQKNQKIPFFDKIVLQLLIK
jgi:hypothetical protein